MPECCGKCKFHKLVQLTYGKEWCCCNPDSDYVGFETDYKDYCSDFEAREGESR